MAEKKATIGYTYEDSTVTEPEPQSDKDEENSENSESEEDEGIPDIGEEMTQDSNSRQPKTTTIYKKNRRKSRNVQRGMTFLVCRSLVLKKTGTKQTLRMKSLFFSKHDNSMLHSSIFLIVYIFL